MFLEEAALKFDPPWSVLSVSSYTVRYRSTWVPQGLRWGSRFKGGVF